MTEANVTESAAAAGTDSPIVFVLLPKIDAEAIRDALASYAAATDTINQRPSRRPTRAAKPSKGCSRESSEGERAADDALRRRRREGERVFQGGGNELTTSLAARRRRDRRAATRSRGCSRSSGSPTTRPGSKVIDKARDGAPDALASVGWTGEVPANPVCKEVLVDGSGARHEGQRPPARARRPAVRLAARTRSTARCSPCSPTATSAPTENGQPVAGPKELPRTQIGKATFYKEDEPPTTPERLAVRGVLTEGGRAVHGRAGGGRHQRASAAPPRARRTGGWTGAAAGTAEHGAARRAGRACRQPAVPRRRGSRRPASPGHQRTGRRRANVARIARPSGPSSTGCSPTPAASMPPAMSARSATLSSPAAYCWRSPTRSRH